MCTSDLLAELRASGVELSESQLRYAIKCGRVSRPRLDGSLKFDFTPENVAEIAAHFVREAQHA